MAAPKHFLQLKDLARQELDYVLARSRQLKARHHSGTLYQPLRGRTLAMIFEKNSTRTRVSFEAGMAQLGGSALYLSARDTQLTRGEPVEDVARVISRMVDLIMIRAFEHGMMERFAAHSQVAVINGLTDAHHPCQILADVATFIEHRGPIKGRTVAWVGDANNVCNTWVQAAQAFDFQLRVAAPDGYNLQPEHGSNVHATSDPREAVDGADLVTTDVWTSMGFEAETEERRRRFAGYQVDAALMRLARADALFMHCLPAHRGEEVSAEVIDGPQSVVWDEAENRLHTQKALMEYLLLGRVVES
jgi:ornithine carbamoyltransferase